MDINLLPPEQIEKLKLFRITRQVWILVAFVLLSSSILMGYLFFMGTRLEAKLAAISKTAAEMNADTRIKDLDEIQGRIEATYRLLEKVEAIKKSEIEPWSDIVLELASFTNGNIEYRSFEVNGDYYEKIKVVGVAKTREDVIRLKSNIEKSDYYKEVFSPISNMTLRETVPFEFTMTLDKEETDK